MDCKVFVGRYSSPTTGKWLDCSDPNFDEEVQKISHPVGPEGIEHEVFVPDAEGFFGFYSESLVQMKEMADLLEDEFGNDEERAEGFVRYYQHVGARDLSDSLREFEEAYDGLHESEEAFVEQLCTDVYGPPPPPYAHRIDWEGMARDFFMGDYFSETSDITPGIHVYHHV